MKRALGGMYVIKKNEPILLHSCHDLFVLMTRKKE